MKNIDYAKISSQNVKFLLLNNGMSIRQLAEKIKIAPTTLNDSLKSKKGISIDSLIKIADCFNVTVNDLCEQSFAQSDNESITIDDNMLLHKFHLLDSHGKELIIMIINKEIERILNEK